MSRFKTKCELSGPKDPKREQETKRIQDLDKKSCGSRPKIGATTKMEPKEDLPWPVPPCRPRPRQRGCKNVVLPRPRLAWGGRGSDGFWRLSGIFVLILGSFM